MNDIVKGFKDFVLRGNVIDLAVAFVIGVAFSDLIKSFTGSFIDPIVRSILGGGNLGGRVHLRGDNYLDFGGFFTAIVTFVITAAVVYFVFVVPINRLRARQAPAPEATPETELDILKQIRDGLNRA
jgi:large conductance mechanosensitive channel